MPTRKRLAPRIAAGALVVAALFLLMGAPSTARAENPFVVRWALGALPNGGTDQDLVSVDKNAELPDGALYRMMVDAMGNVFIYVIQAHADGHLDVLFPGDAEVTDRGVAKGRYYLPGDDAWLEYDAGGGKRVVYLLAGVERATELEDRLAEYDGAADNEKPARGRAVLAVIKQLRRKHAKLAAAAEKPAAIGGNVRGLGVTSDMPDVAKVATQIDADTFYCRIVTIGR